MTQPPTITYTRRTTFPTVAKSQDAVEHVIRVAAREGRLGLDLEFTPMGPTIIGVASENEAAAWWWSRELGTLAISGDHQIAAYAGLASDRPVIEKALNRSTPLTRWEDSMIKHWCVNPDLASVPKSQMGEDSIQDSTIGMMNIWVATSMLHDVPHWKGLVRKAGDSITHICGNPEECLRDRLPCPEHDELTYCAIDAWAGLVDDLALDAEMSRLRIPRSYYEFRRELSEYCYEIQQKGVRVDLPLIARLEETIQARRLGLFPYELSYEGKTRTKKTTVWEALYEDCRTLRASKKLLLPKVLDGFPRTAIAKVITTTSTPIKLKNPIKVWAGPFNPNSPPAVTTWFAERGIMLTDRQGQPSMGKQILLKRLDEALAPFGLEFDVKTADVVGTYDSTLPEPVDMLLRLTQKTCAGKGLKSWFDPKYITGDRIHSRLNATGTSMMRLSSSKPNNQNVSKHGWGAEVRRVYIPEPGCDVLGADYSSLELFVCLWFARSSKSGEGIFEWLVEHSDGQLEAAAKVRSMKVRDVAKSISHASDLSEGLVLLSPDELLTPYRIAERSAKALRVYDGDELPFWGFRGRIVCYTGANLAERLFKDRTRENRARALALQDLYFGHLPEIRDVFHRETMTEIEHPEPDGVVRVRMPNGHVLPLYGHRPEDDVKQALAQKAQGGGAVYAQENMLRMKRLGRVMQLQVHDEYRYFDIPSTWTDDQALDYMRVMVEPSELLPGFTCPAKVSRGKNWREGRELAVIRYLDVTSSTVSTSSIVRSS